MEREKPEIQIEKSELEVLMDELPVYRSFERFSDMADFILPNMPQARGSNLVEYILDEVQSDRGEKHNRINSIKLTNQMQSQLPIELAVIACAHKNPNPEICGGSKKPDFAEFYFILHLHNIAENIKRMYEPGAHFTILTEGELYKDFGLFDVTNEELADYMTAIQRFTAEVAGGNISFHPLRSIVNTNPNFYELVEVTKKGLKPTEYEHLAAVMAKSLSSRQLRDGGDPREMAKTYTAIHSAKHHCTSQGGSAVYEFLTESYGPNFIYTSVTSSRREEVLNIDPYPHSSLLPQHGIGLLAGGAQKLNTVPFTEIVSLLETTDMRIVNVEETPFGLMRFGRRKK